MKKRENMSTVLFVTPTIHPRLEDEPLGTLILATIVRQHGVDVDVYRFFDTWNISQDLSTGTEHKRVAATSGIPMPFDLFVRQTAQHILSRNPRIVSFYCRCDQYLAMIRIAQHLKEQNPSVWIIFGGPQADAAAQATLREIPWVDLCCCGEGERTIWPLISALLYDKDYTGIAGLTYRDAAGQVCQNPLPPLLEHLDDSPRIDYSLVPHEMMCSHASDSPSVARIDVGRGCPFHCTYCSTSIFWQRSYRMKSNSRILSEIRELHDVYGFQAFSFMHDLFTANKKRVLDLCEKLRVSGMDVRFTCSSRADTLDEETICAMRQAGWRHVYIGIESGSERMQKMIRKNLDLSQVYHCLEMLSQYGIHVTASFIFGFPEETAQDVSRTMAFAFRIAHLSPLIEQQFHLCAVFYGTEMYTQYQSFLTFAPVQSNAVGDFGVPKNLDFIMSHRAIFPHYYEYRSELRNRLKYFEPFMLAMLHALPYIDLILPYYTDDTLLSFYDELVAANGSFFSQWEEEGASIAACRKNRYALLAAYAQHTKTIPPAPRKVFSELVRYEQVKQTFLQSTDAVCLETFAADLNALENNVPLDQIAPSQTVVQLTRLGDRCRVSFLHRDQSTNHANIS